MATKFDFVRGRSGQLKHRMKQSGYVGGSNLTSVVGFRAYILAKVVKQSDPGFLTQLFGNDEKLVADAFSECWYRHVSNARTAEDELLGRRSTDWNTLSRSGLQDTPGFVYVLVV